MTRWIGVDFSGDIQSWKATRRDSNVWIAEVDGDYHVDRLVQFRQVPSLPAGQYHHGETRSLAAGPTTLTR